MIKTIYLFAVLMLAVMPAQAGDYDFIDEWFTDGANWSRDAPSFKIYYDSVDGQKNPVRLSATVYYEPNNDGTTNPIKRILLSCHPTVTGNSGAPSGIDPLDKDVSRMAGAKNRSYIVVCPDYCGYGVTSHMQHPYLIHDITARNCIDAVLEVLNDPRITFAEDYRTDIMGYSQGGATALACAKYLESDGCPQGVKDRVRLYQTACGDGPYSAMATVNTYMEWGSPMRDDGGEDLEYPCVLPLIVMAAKDAYNEGCMRTVNVEDYFSEAFLATGVIDLLKTKNVGTDRIDDMIAMTMPRRRPVDLFNEKIIDKKTGKFITTNNAYKCLMRAMNMAELSTGWEPKHRIVFYHHKSDKVVPYSNYEAVKNGIQHDYPGLVSFIEPMAAHEQVPALVKFVKNLGSVDWDNVDHSYGGLLFYCAYMMSEGMR